VSAQFIFNVMSVFNECTLVANHKFSEESSDWGFTQFMKLSALHDPRLGYLKDDKLVVIIEVELLKEDKSGFYWNLDSKKETGYVGLKNQGATCYMNSLLQALFHVPTFRKAVYQLPTDNEVPTKSIQLALQRIFYRLQFGNTSVGTKELTKSFGWTAVDSFTQHDVQELDRVLLDNLQTKMKGTKAEGTVEKLFQGKIRNFIKCVNIDFESNREVSNIIKHFSWFILYCENCLRPKSTEDIKGCRNKEYHFSQVVRSKFFIKNL
jgi:ubiquitin carboxyl-terminal hydrolase 7